MSKMINNFLGLHEKALEMKNTRMEVLAKNIANADTPGFKARDVDFKSILAGQAGLAGLRTTHKNHLKSTVIDHSGMVYTIPYNPAMDGNTVEISREQAKYGRAALDYQASLDFLQSRISSVRRALKGE